MNKKEFTNRIKLVVRGLEENGLDSSKVVRTPVGRAIVMQYVEGQRTVESVVEAVRKINLLNGGKLGSGTLLA